MRIAIVQPAADLATPGKAYRDEVALLAAVLMQARHEVALYLLDRHGEDAMDAVAEMRPEIVLLYVESLVADLAFGAAGALASRHPAPVIALGPHAALEPDECLSITGVEAVAVGPADVAIPEYLRSRRASPDSSRTPGMWVKCESGVMRNPPARPPASIQGQPPPARELYPWDQLLDAAGRAYIGVARGGEAGLPPDAGATPGGTPTAAPRPAAPAPSPMAAAWPVLHRSVDDCLREMLRVADEQLDLAGWRIGNDRWASSPPWLAQFAEQYARDVALPLRTTLHAPDVTQGAADLLAKAGCEEVAIAVGSGSSFIRADILGLAAPAEAIEAAFAALRRAGVAACARVEVGAPYETDITLEETADFLQRLAPDRVEAVLHYPVPGTYAWKVAKENGWLVPDAAAAHLAGRPAVALRNLSADDLVAAGELLPYLVLRPHIVPLLRLARRVKIGKRGTVYDLVVKPFLAPPTRRKK